MENNQDMNTNSNETPSVELGDAQLKGVDLLADKPLADGDTLVDGGPSNQELPSEDKKKERKIRDYSTRKPKSVDDRTKRLFSMMKVVVKIKRDQDADASLPEQDKVFTTAQVMTILNAPYRNWGKAGKVKENSYSADISTGIKTLGFVNVGKGKSVGRGRNPFLYKLEPEQLSLKGKILYLAATKELKIEPFKFSDEVMSEIEKKVSDEKKSKDRSQGKKEKQPKAD